VKYVKGVLCILCCCTQDDPVMSKHIAKFKMKHLIVVSAVM